MLDEGKIEKAIIVCTKSSILSFESNFKQTNYPLKNLITLRTNDDFKLINKANNKIFLIQYESLLNMNLRELISHFRGLPSGLFIDEVHKVKTIGKSKGKKSSITASILGYIRPHFNYVVGLTATTMTSKLEDAYRVIDFIKPKTLGGWNWFRDNFCNIEEGTRWNKKLKKYIPYSKIVSYKNLDKFIGYTKDVMIQYFPKLDYRFKVLSKSMKPGSKRALRYDELAKSTHGRNSDNHSSVMPKLQRLVDKSAAKKFLLKKCVEQCRKDGLIIYTRTRKASMIEYIQSLLEEYNMDVRVICGSTKKEEREEIVLWGFEGEPTNKALIITDAGSASLNCHWTNNLVFWEIPMGPGKYLQTKGRIGRMFSKWDHYNLWFLLIKNTIDEYWFLRFTSNKEVINTTGDDSSIPVSKMNTYNERKLKKERDSKVWRKTKNTVKGVKATPTPKGSKRITKKPR